MQMLKLSKKRVVKAGIASKSNRRSQIATKKKGSQKLDDGSLQD